MEAMPSPAECLLLLTPIGGVDCEVDIIVGSHRFPEFTADGRSRWVDKDASSAADMAVQNGASVQTVSLGEGGILLLGPGTLFRTRVSGGSKCVACLAVPNRADPYFLVTRPSHPYRISHGSGAALVA